MASDRGYLEFILEQLADLDGVRARAMMGEYILYYRDRVIGGIYDDRLLVKSTPGAAAYMPSATEELPYPGAKPMLLVDNVDAACLTPWWTTCPPLGPGKNSVWSRNTD